MLEELTASQWLARLEAREVSSVELTQACLDRIRSRDAEIGAFLSLQEASALQQAAAIDQRRAAGNEVGALAGLPVAIKDVLCTRGEPTTCGSKYLEHFKPPYDATVVRRLREADAVLIGKTNMDEFAMGGSGENSGFRATANPWDTQRVPGGSSSGSAACVAADMAPVAIGTDTGGSIRQPSAFCGISGLKPTYGRVSRYGLVAFASSLDQAGPMARSAEDLARTLQVIAGHDAHDSTCSPAPVPDYLAALREPLKGIRLGRVAQHFESGGDAETLAAAAAAIDELRRLGAEVVDIELPHSKYAIATYYVIAPCEASSNLSRYDGMHYGHRADEAEVRKLVREDLESASASGASAGSATEKDKREMTLVQTYCQSRSEGLGGEVKRRIMLGTYALSEGYQSKYYLKALQVRRLIRQDYEAAFASVDAIVGPVTPTPAFAIGEKTNDPLAMYLGDLFTVSANLAGIPALSTPCGLTSQQLPVGLHLQGPMLGEARLLQIAHAYQQVTDWHTRRPR
ncbi:MAG: aspartyl/glutamyl-tRNA amidotransferase subunit A [Planctomycetales bacterium]|nr:aspartyl/glutamyl-tRNA amidotransferase subunit A [Planctomycetales bacterium]